MKNKFKLIGVYDYTVILTYMSLCFAIFGMLSGIRGKYTLAILCLVGAGICDAFDGIVARSKKNRTEDEKAFGIQLDSLCDVIGFGIFPAFLCYFMGMNSVLGIVILCIYPLCAVIRLAFFNVLEGKRQQTEAGCAKSYRGLPVTSISILLPFVYLFHSIMPEQVFVWILHGLMLVVAFLFVYDFSVPKPDWKKILTGK